MIIASHAATSRSIITNTAAGRLTTVSTGSVLAEQDVNRALFYWFLNAVQIVVLSRSAQVLQPASDDEHPLLLGFSPFASRRAHDRGFLRCSPAG